MLSLLIRSDLHGLKVFHSPICGDYLLDEMEVRSMANELWRMARRFRLIVGAVLLLVLLALLWLCNLLFEDYVVTKFKEANVSHHWEIGAKILYLLTTYPTRSAVIITCTFLVISEAHNKVRERALWKAAFGGEEKAAIREDRHSPSRNVGVRDWPGEWLDSESRFRKWEKSGVFAELFNGQWTVRRDRNNDNSTAKEEVEAACELAGGRLINSPGIALSDTVRSQTEHWKQWLQFVKETQGLNRIFSGANENGYIEGIARVSALVCTKCAARAHDS